MPDGDGEDKGWREGLPAELVAAPYFRDADSLEAAVADLSRAADVQGNSIRVPGPDADDAARSEFYDSIVAKAPGVMRSPDMDDQGAVDAVLAKLGRPAEANEYALTDVEGITVPDEKVGELKAFAHKAGLTRKQFDAFMGQLLTNDASKMGTAQTAHDAELAALKGEWGAAYDQRVGKITKMLELTGGEARLAESLAEGNLTANEMRWFHGLAEKLGGGEGGEVGGQGKSEPAPVMTPHEAILQLAELEKGRIGVFMPPEEQAAFIKRRMELLHLSRAGSTVEDSALRRAARGT
jgi:hypothetical protein